MKLHVDGGRRPPGGGFWRATQNSGVRRSAAYAQAASAGGIGTGGTGTGGAFRHDEKDAAGPYLDDTLAMGMEMVFASLGGTRPDLEQALSFCRELLSRWAYASSAGTACTR